MYMYIYMYIYIYIYIYICILSSDPLFWKTLYCFGSIFISYAEIKGKWGNLFRNFFSHEETV